MAGPSDTDDRTTSPAEDLDRSTDRWMAVGVFLMVVLVAAFPIYRLQEPGRRADARAARLAAAADEGARLFDASCAQCHGVSGTGGRGPALGSQGFLTSVTDDQIMQLTAIGVPGSEMVSYSIDYGGPLTSEQIEAISVYLRSLEDGAPDLEAWRRPLAAEDLSGQDLYRMVCAACHGVDLAGRVTEGDRIPALGPGSEAVEDSDVRIVRRVTEGAAGMPGFGGTLSEGQIEQIVAYLREVQGADGA